MKRRLAVANAAKNPKCGTCTACCTTLGVSELDVYVATIAARGKLRKN